MIEGQRKTLPKPIIIKREEEFKVEKILNKRVVRGKEKFLVWWKRYTVEEDTWESRENLKNIKKLVEEFEKEYSKKAKEVQQQEEKKNKKVFSRELPGSFMAKILWRWSNKEYKRQRKKKWKKNWRQWKNSLKQENLKGWAYHKWPLTDLWVDDLIIKRLKKVKFR